MKPNSNEIIGLDRLNRPVQVGDHIVDASGKKYTVTERGKCKAADGKEVNFSGLKGIELDLFLSTLENTSGNAVEAPKPSMHAYDEPKLSGHVKKEPKPRKPRKASAGRKNRTGFVLVSVCASEAGYSGKGATECLRNSDIKVTKRGPKNYICIEDREKAVEILRYNVTHPAVKVCCEAPSMPEISPEEKAVLDSLVGPAPLDLRDVTDQQLADELRRRGFEVTATKTVVVSL